MPQNAFSDSELKQFIADYTAGDEQHIRFQWNGKHGDDFKDWNYEFRKEVLAAVLEDTHAAPLDLVRDLYLAETRFSREAWGIDFRVRQLAEHLLRHGEDRYIEDYLDGKGESFDASLAASSFPIDLPLAQHLLTIVQRRLQDDTYEGRRELLEMGEETFRRWVSNFDSEGSAYPVSDQCITAATVPFRQRLKKIISAISRRLRFS